jgi:hypothetical protein
MRPNRGLSTRNSVFNSSNQLSFSYQHFGRRLTGQRPTFVIVTESILLIRNSRFWLFRSGAFHCIAQEIIWAGNSCASNVAVKITRIFFDILIF